MNESLSLMAWLYGQEGGSFVVIFSENTSSYFLKAVGKVTFLLAAS